MLKMYAKRNEHLSIELNPKKEMEMETKTEKKHDPDV